MIDELQRRAHEIFVAALDREPEERASLLSQACDGDAGLRAAVDRLLRAVEDTAQFLEAPALGALVGVDSGPEPLPPDAIAGYRIAGLLGVGGMASVYEAEQDKPRRRVAIKVMHRSLVHTSSMSRFHFEAEVLAKLKHPGIAQVFEVGAFRDASGRATPFFAMEFVDGARPITAYAASQSLGLRARLAMFAAVCDAVQHGHQVGVIHRDLKPSNVLVDSEGRPKIIDFGVARSMLTDTDRITMLNERGQIIGTLNSMSPEQCAGGDRVDTRSDVYSLGVILYELLTGRPPYDLTGKSIPEAIGVIQSQGAARPGSLDPSLKGDIEAIVLMAMDKDPERRYQGADALAADIRRFLGFKAIQAALPTPWRRAGLFMRRHKVISAAFVVTGLTLALSALLVGVFAYRTWQESERRLVAESVAVVERDTALRQAYAASLAGAFLAHRVGEVTQAREHLERAPVSRRGWEWGLISGYTDSGEVVIPAHDDQVMDMAFAPAARRLASISRDGSVSLWEVDSGGLVARVPPSVPSEWASVAISPDGRAVYYGLSDGVVREWAPDSGGGVREVVRLSEGVRDLSLSVDGMLATVTADGEALLRSLADPGHASRLEAPQRGATGVQFSPDGSRLLVWSVPGTLLVQRVDSRVAEWTLTLGSSVHIGVWSDDGALLAVGGGEGRVVILDAHTGRFVAESNMTSDVSTVRSLAFKPGRESVVIGSVNRGIVEWRFVGEQRRYRMAGHDEAVSALVFDGDANRLISASWDSTVRLWPLDELTLPGAQTFLPRHGEHALSVAFSQDGSMLASAGRDDIIRVLDSHLGIELAVLRGYGGDVYSARFSPDGSALASASTDGAVRVWDLLTGECVRVLEGPGATLWTVEFSPDGRRLASAGADGVVTVWDPRDGAVVTVFRASDQRVLKLAYSPDGSMIATCARDGAVALWDAATGNMLRRLSGHRSDAFSCVFSPDGARLYTGSRDQTVRVWSVRTGEELATLSCRGHFITSVTVNEDGSRLAAGSWYGEITVWDLSTYDRVLSFPTQQAAIRELAFSPSGPLLAVTGHGGFLIRYNGMRHAERVRHHREALSAWTDAVSVARGATVEEIEALRGALGGVVSSEQRWLQKALLRRASSGRPVGEEPQ